LNQVDDEVGRTQMRGRFQRPIGVQVTVGRYVMPIQEASSGTFKFADHAQRAVFSLRLGQLGQVGDGIDSGPLLRDDDFQGTLAKTQGVVDYNDFVCPSLVLGHCVKASNAQLDIAVAYLAYNVGGTLEPGFDLGDGLNLGNVLARVSLSYFHIAGLQEIQRILLQSTFTGESKSDFCGHSNQKKSRITGCEPARFL
jgi:hypothetical protein